MKIRTVSFACMIVTILAVLGCGGGGDISFSSPPPPFFTVVTVYSVNGFVRPDPNVGVIGTAFLPAANCLTNPNGISSFSSTTNGNAQYTVQNAAVGVSTCVWTINRGASPNCPNPSITGTKVTANPSATVNVPCNGSTIFTADPNIINLNNPPSTITITGQNMDATYGMPQVTFYDVNQTALLTVTAISVSGDGTSLTIPADQVVFSNDSYGAVVYVKASDGTWNSIGGAGINVFTPDFGGDGGTCNPPMPCN
jgi:hypothetical protein